ncbi:hypothetical protein PUN28_007375 [Cardiocondyla obscurior]|uniref:Uncharacterized protein n=1 Tax=Cardiocondyla obscurior TaxID=286306 RepID=A0AAW2G4N0_9HYME
MPHSRFRNRGVPEINEYSLFRNSNLTRDASSDDVDLECNVVRHFAHSISLSLSLVLCMCNTRTFEINIQKTAFYPSIILLPFERSLRASHARELQLEMHASGTTVASRARKVAHTHTHTHTLREREGEREREKRDAHSPMTELRRRGRGVGM